MHIVFKSPAAKEILAYTRERGIKLYNMDDYYFTRRASSSNTLIAGYAGVDAADINYLKEVLS